MERTITVNLGGQAFVFDEEAFDILKDYLRQIEGELKYASDTAEILKDVEIRIAEILKEDISVGIVSKEKVKEIIKIMGEPADFCQAFDDGDGEEGAGKYKRIYRDPDNRWLGGVCAGLGAYFDVDPLLIRVVFLVSIVTVLAGPLTYLIMWVVVPEATTESQKRQMRGGQFNVSDIGSQIKQEFTNVKRKMKL